MPFAYRALASVWLILLGLFALSASSMVVGKNVLWLVFGGLVTPVLILTVASTFSRSARNKE